MLDLDAIFGAAEQPGRKNGRTAGEKDPIDTVRRLWAWLLGSEPITTHGAHEDISTTTGNPVIDAVATELRRALLTLTGASGWPANPESLNGAFGRLVSAGVLLRVERGQLALARGADGLVSRPGGRPALTRGSQVDLPPIPDDWPFK
jgi:hypothetical protein